MLYNPRMLMLGSAGRNSGKTEFACAVIKACAARGYHVAGAKVSAVRRGERGCPRGGEGCGVCGSLDGPFCITRETEAGPKDTQRLLAAGASEVYWLRVFDDRLDEGAAALSGILGTETLSICESNSLRRAIEPGLFLLLRHEASDTAKASAQAVARYADRVVLSDGRRFDPEPNALDAIGNGWILRYPATAIVLAGGRSARMGRDKSFLDVNGLPLIAHVCAQLRPHFEELIVSANEPDRFDFLDARVVCDRIPDRGPVMGIVSALRVSRHDLNFVVACDVPIVPVRLMKALLREARQEEIVVPRTSGDHVHPLFGVYRKSAAARLESALESGHSSARGAIERGQFKYIDVDTTDVPGNLNTREEYEAFVAGNYVTER